MSQQSLTPRNAVALAVAGMVSVQFGAAIAAQLFDVVDPSVVLVVRQGVTAIVLLLLVRPRLSEVSAGQWRVAAVFGLAIAGMNLAMYQAIDRLPLGLAVTVELCGPLALSVVLARRRLDLAWTALALGGLLLFRASSLGAGGAIGIGFALGAAAGWFAYLLAGAEVGRRFQDQTGLAIGLGIATLCTAPIALSHDMSPLGEPPVLGKAVMVALLSALVPFSFDVISMRVLGAKVMSVLVSLSPVIAGLAGLVVLGQRLTGIQIAGMACIVIAATGAVLSRPRSVATAVPDAELDPTCPTIQPTTARVQVKHLTDQCDCRRRPFDVAARP